MKITNCRSLKRGFLNTSVLLVYIFFFTFPVISSASTDITRAKFVIDEKTSFFINGSTWQTAPTGGDTIFILSTRTKALKFQEITGTENSPVVVINFGGQVNINSPEAWGAITFENCRYIKITGNGEPSIKYGFKLSAKSSGLAFSELSSDCEAGFIHIDHKGFFGIYAKKDYGGNPPVPAPVFANLVIHDCLVENVTEGMYLGETKSPGMEFRHVKIYNNIVRNTRRESIQIANMTEDVKIFNNTLLNAGTANETWQNNNLQIGDNSVALVYNNIIIGAPSFGIISLGVGNIKIKGNYVGANKGIFTDNRLFSLAETSIDINKNYFFNTTSAEVIRNMNEINRLNITGNFWNANTSFYKNASGNNLNTNLADNLKTSIPALVFTNPEINNYTLSENTPEVFKNMGVQDSFVYNGNTDDKIFAEPHQVVLTPDMIVDEVAGGSYWTASYLVDEQNPTPENNLHPASQVWKPYWNMDKGPYYIYFDLKSEHKITNIFLHDMHNSKNLKVFIGEPGNWELLFTDACEKFNTWKQHPVDVFTRYIRIGMEESVFAGVNELIIYGYKTSESPLKSEQNTFLTTGTSVKKINAYPDLKINRNPAINSLEINIPNDCYGNFDIEIFDINGSRKYAQAYSHMMQNNLIIDLSQLSLLSGIYFVRYNNRNGIKKTMKFVKSNF